ncbi:unnamed protein product, partial [Ostreobium quekettii]
MASQANGETGAPVLVKARPAAPKFKAVLTLDGGGTRGVISVMVLHKLEELIKANIRDRGLAEGDFEIDLADYFDMVAGTSIGSITALYLASRGAASGEVLRSPEFLEVTGGTPARQGSVAAVEALFRAQAKVIFPKLMFANSRLVGLARAKAGPQFASDGLAQVLQGAFGDMRLSQCATGVVVPTFELNTSRPVDFWVVCEGGDPRETGRTEVKTRSVVPEGEQLMPHSDPAGVHWDPDRSYLPGDYKLREVAAASAAFPGMFAASSITHPDGSSRIYADGGLIASNPTISALTFLRVKEDVPLEETAVLSIGTGVVLPDRLKVKDSGIFDWIFTGGLVSLLLDQKSEYVQSVVDGMFYKVLHSEIGQYTRIQIAVDQENEFGIDTEALSSVTNPEMLDELMEIGRRLANSSEK